MSKKELISNIKEEILKCGYPLEIFVIETCSKKNTGRLPNVRYQYNGELRELDLHAFFTDKTYSEDEKKIIVSNLIIECKKSNNPWVFFSSQMHQNSESFTFLEYKSSYDLKANSIKTTLKPSIRSHLKNNHYLDISLPRCISYFEPFSKQNSSNIYRAIQSVLNFMSYEEERYTTKAKRYSSITAFYYPIIVFDGNLFEAKIYDKNIRVIERDHIQIRGILENRTYIIDVVKKEYFPKFFDILEKDHNEIVNILKTLKID